MKFRQQEYPAELIDEQCEKIRKLDRENLIYKKKDKEKQKKKAKEMRSCVVITYNPDNPPLHYWVNSLL